MNPCRNNEWLAFHYYRRPRYLEWCKENGEIPDENGGMGMTLTACSELAGVAPKTIREWLIKLDMHCRDISESQIGEYNLGYNKPRSKKFRRNQRDTFFEQYRNGTINIVLGSKSYTNGVQTTKEETAIKRTNRRIAEATQCNQD